MQSQRFFIGNLPLGTTENDIKKAFKGYDVAHIELKEKENLVDPANKKLLAFITVQFFDGNLDFCLKELNSKPINGEYVTVSVAKESFLERLKREREENAAKSSQKSSSHEDFKNPPIRYPNNSKKIFNTEEDEQASESNIEKDEDESYLITKKRASNSIRNGKIVIEGKGTPIHVIGKQTETKELSEKSLDSDKKRKESLKKKKNQYQLQKSLIQKSLSSVDATNKKQIFFDEESDDNDIPSVSKPLFQEESDQENDSYANDFSVNPEYEGSRGAALMKLQSQMNLDPRFKIDSKFVDTIEEEEPVKTENSERDWQYGILEQVVGNKVSIPSQSKKREKNKLQMLRYDPSKENQDQFLVKRKKVEPIEEDVNKTLNVEHKNVSKEVFYMVSENLSNSLKSRGDGFSLLSMFGKSTEENEKSAENQLEEKILISNDKNSALNPFTYDSSESENEQEHPQKSSNKEKTNSETKVANDSQLNLFTESFFIPRNDARLKEGKLFFRSNPSSEKIENYDEVKSKLKQIINRKINKSKKNLQKPMGKKSARRR